MSKQITTTNRSLSEENIQDLFKKAEFLIEKEMVPSSIKKPQDLVNIIKIGQSIGLDEVSALNSIDIIQGAVSLKAKIIPGLLARNGVAVQVIKDYEQLYDEKPTPLTGPDKKPIVDEEGKMKYYCDPDGNPVLKKHYKDDYVTTLRFKRYFPNIGVVENDISFYWSDAVATEWHKKPNWKKMPRYMMMARCMSRGARIAASDLMAGMYDNYEVAEFTGVDFDVNEDTGDLNIKEEN